MAEERKRELPLPMSTYAYVLDSTKGVIKIFVGPTVITPTGQDRPVKYDPKTFRFVDCDLEDALQQKIVVPEGFYAVLTNPAAKDKATGKLIFPTEGQTQSIPPLQIGLKEIIPGNESFALWPGQMCEVRRGHHLRSNEYLRIKIYNEERAKENWQRAVINTATDSGGKAVATTMEMPADLAVGKQYNILGTKVAFYIPPTGVSVVPEGVDEAGKPIFVRQAETLEQLEYSILVDEDGNKEYPRGPAVVFPEPTQQFMVARDQKGEVLVDATGAALRKFRAIEMNALQGIHLKFMKEGVLHYADGTEEMYEAGEERFVRGDRMPIYYPEEGHQLVRYDGKTIHYAVAVTDGEGKYVLERESGNVKLLKGPMMLLPDPVAETIAYRALSDRESRVWFPGADGKGSSESLSWNRKLREEAGHAPTTRQGVVSEGQLKPTGEAAFLSMNANATPDVLMNFSASAGTERSGGRRSTKSAMPESRQGKDQQAVVGDVAERRSTYNEPRAIIFASKFRGVPTIKVQPGYAVNVIRADGTRKPVIGPKTVLLEFAETLDILRLSMGKPKTTDSLFETAYLNIHNNKVTDIVEVETSDHVVVSLKLSYNVSFEGQPEKWFTIENYVKHLCDHVRSILKGAVRKKTIEEFYRDSTDQIRTFLLGEKSLLSMGSADPHNGEHTARAKHPGLLFEENGMRVADVEVLKVEISDSAIAQLLARSQHDVVRQNIDLSLKEKEVVVTKRRQELEQESMEAIYGTEAKGLEIQSKRLFAEADAEREMLSNKLENSDLQRQLALLTEQITDVVNKAFLERERLKSESEEHFADMRQEREMLLLSAQVNAIERQFKAIEPGLIEALQAHGAGEMLAKIAHSLSVHQMFGSRNALEFLRDVFASTPLQGMVEGLITKASALSPNGSVSLASKVPSPPA